MRKNAHTESLAAIRRIGLYRYTLTRAYAAAHSEDETRVHLGPLAQELRSVLPDAVKASGRVELADGSAIESLLVVDKERVFMEAVAAVQALAAETVSV